MKRKGFSIGIIFLLLAMVCTTCTKDETLLTPDGENSTLKGAKVENASAKQVRQVDIIAGLTVDVDGFTIIPILADPATLLYYRRTGFPILAPDEHHVTAGEFIAAEGTAVVKCRAPGTQVKLRLSRLIPNALYRIWILTFKEPGFNPQLPNPFVNAIGEGSLGPNDRSRNTFWASADGKGKIVRLIPEGVFSEFGFAEDCLLTDVFEWHIVGAFQQPGQPHGPDVGPPVFFPNSAVEQFVFVFRQ
ncbi:MAG: hypothetical protein KAI29_16915 [Cyclobacteriaceae bacterium]|nr:hypothetical protein [Cyclobacteriaceae bacterium]